MELVNYSVTGNKSDQLSILRKIGVAIFILGLFIFFNSEGFRIKSFGLNAFTKSNIGKITGFSMITLGVILFTLKTFGQATAAFHFKGNKPSFPKIIGIISSFIGFILIGLIWFGIDLKLGNVGSLLAVFGSFILGIALITYSNYANKPAGIKNNFAQFNQLGSNGIFAWSFGIILTLFYVQLYCFNEKITPLYAIFEPLSMALRGRPADQWFMYGTFYTFVIAFLGIKFMIKYRHNRYQLIRTVVVIFSQLILAYFIPTVLEGLNMNYASDEAGNYLGGYSANPIYSWPLNYSAYQPDTLKGYSASAYQPIGMAYLVWSIILFLIVTPFVTFLFGKRWYCSWFCGCGGLAETAGDSFRHLSDKSERAWKIERWVMHSVMVFVLIMTIGVSYTYFAGKEVAVALKSVNKHVYFPIVASLLILSGLALWRIFHKRERGNLVIAVGIGIFASILVLLTMSYFTGHKDLFFVSTKTLKSSYGFLIGSIFSGVIGVGFYPILGNRVWCRFGCPMAGYMGLFQRFYSRFRITTNGGQCISCGNCSTYCEQGIDVRAYAQKGEDIKRSSCVGCGICSAVCPRGVLKLENGPVDLIEMMKR